MSPTIMKKPEIIKIEDEKDKANKIEPDNILIYEADKKMINLKMKEKKLWTILKNQEKKEKRKRSRGIRSWTGKL